MVEQISVFLENKSGRLSEVTGILAEAGVNIRAMALADTSNFGVLRLLVDHADKAAESLKENGFTVRKTEVVAVEIDDRPGGLHQALELIGRADLNIEYMYSYTRTSNERAVIIFRLDDMSSAIRFLKQHGATILTGEALR